MSKVSYELLLCCVFVFNDFGSESTEFYTNKTIFVTRLVGL